MLKKMLLLLLFIIFVALIFVISRSLKVVSTYAAKEMCACYYLANRQVGTILNQDLNVPMINLANATADTINQTATATVFGMFKTTAVFRKGLGCAVLHAPNTITSLRDKGIELPRVTNTNPDSIAWPNGDLVMDSLRPTFNSTKLSAALDSIADKAKRSRAILVIYKGQPIAEWYAEGFDRSSLHQAWSMNKSLNNTMMGVLVNQHKVDIDAPPHFGSWDQSDRKNITIRNLLEMTDGLNWQEDYYNPYSTFASMAFFSNNMAETVLQYPAAYKPGRHWAYSSGAANLLSYCIRQTIGDDREYHEFPYREIFNKIGMRSITLETDASGTFVTSSYSYATARDWARFGLLYLNDGIWNGERIFPEGWVDLTRTGSDASDKQYGSQFWLAKSGHPKFGIENLKVNDVYFARGHNGQRVFIIPSKKLVIVRFGLKNISPEFTGMFINQICSAVE